MQIGIMPSKQNCQARCMYVVVEFRTIQSLAESFINITVILVEKERMQTKTFLELERTQSQKVKLHPPLVRAKDRHAVTASRKWKA